LGKAIGYGIGQIPAVRRIITRQQKEEAEANARLVAKKAEAAAAKVDALAAKADAAASSQLNFQTPATTIMEKIVDLHHDLMFFIIVVVVFVS